MDSQSSIFDFLISICPDIEEVVEVQVDRVNEAVGWHSLVILKNGFCVSGGTSENRMEARRKALAEAIERTLVDRLAQTTDAQLWWLDRFPGTSGFAVGFSQESTKLRSIFEGVEHAIRRSILNVEFPFLRVKAISDLTKLGNHILRAFQNTQFFSLPLGGFLESGESLPPVTMMLTLTDTQWGKVAGYQVDMLNPAGWEHALVEMDRNYRNLEALKAGRLSLRDQTLGAELTVLSNTKIAAGHSADPVNVVEVFRKGMEIAPGIYLFRSISNLVVLPT